MLGSDASALPSYSSYAHPQVVAQAPISSAPIIHTQAAIDQLESGPPVQHAVEKEAEKDSSGLVLPLARVKRIIKSEGDVKAVSSEASFAVARAAELLLEELARRANLQMHSQHRSTLQYKDVDIVPQQVAVSTLLEKYRQQHPELVHVQPQPQPNLQANGTANPAAMAGGQQAFHHGQQPMAGRQTLQQPVANNLLLLQQQQQQAQQQLLQQQQPARPVFAQAHSQQLPHSQLAQLVPPRMQQHFPVAEQVQQALGPRQASATDTSFAAQRPAAAQLSNQHPLLSQHQHLVKQSESMPQQGLSGVSQPLHVLNQQQLAAQLLSVQQTAHQQPLLQQLQQQQRMSQPLSQHPAVAQYFQQQALQQQQQQQQHAQQAVLPHSQVASQHSQLPAPQSQITGQQKQ